MLEGWEPSPNLPVSFPVFGGRYKYPLIPNPFSPAQGAGEKGHNARPAVSFVDERAAM